MILTNLWWKLHCQILQISHSIRVQMLKSGWERQSHQKRRWKCISFLRGYSHEENLNLSGVERWETPAALQHCYRRPFHSELWPQAFIGLFPSFKYFQESKATRTAQTWLPTPWPPPALSRYNRHPPASLCSEPGAFCFCQKDFSKLLSSHADWLTCNLLFLGNAPTLSGSRHSQLPAPNGDLAVTFSWASQDPR